MENDTKPCPFCGETIKSEAKKCKHCGEWLNKEASEQNDPINNENDPLLNIYTYNNILMILMAIMFLAIVQPGWLCWLINKSKTEKAERNISYLNKIDNRISVSIPIIIMLLNVISVLVLFFVGGDIWSFIILIDALILSILEIKYANSIEQHIYKQYGVNVRLNKVCVFFLQSIYLNYFFLTYKERIEKAKRN